MFHFDYELSRMCGINYELFTNEEVN